MKPGRPLTDTERELMDELYRRLDTVVRQIAVALDDDDARCAQAPLAALVIVYPAVVALKDRVKDA